MNIRIANVRPLLSYTTAGAFVIFGIYLDVVVDDYFRPIAAYASACAALLPELAHRFGPTRPLLTPRALATIQTAWSIQLSLNGIGSLGFYIQYQYYDMTLHVLGPLLICWYWALLLVHTITSPISGIWNEPTMIILIAMAVIVLEVWEWFADRTLGTASLTTGRIWYARHSLGIVSMLPCICSINGIYIDSLLETSSPRPRLSIHEIRHGSSFKHRGHAIIPSSPSYLKRSTRHQQRNVSVGAVLMGETHPQEPALLIRRNVFARRLMNRTTSLTFLKCSILEFGDYFKKKYRMDMKFWLIQQRVLARSQRPFTCFEGEGTIPKMKRPQHWKNVGMPEHRIFLARR